eukprot:3284223-Prorocentrum_lima.AAC.1
MHTLLGLGVEGENRLARRAFALALLCEVNEVFAPVGYGDCRRAVFAVEDHDVRLAANPGGHHRMRGAEGNAGVADLNDDVNALHVFCQLALRLGDVAWVPLDLRSLRVEALQLFRGQVGLC